MTFGFRIGASTDVGEQRDIQQDSYALATNVVVVADGMGGHRGGEVASSLAAREMIEQYTTPQIESLVHGVEQANQRILDKGALDPTLRGMGTTVVALALIHVEDGIALGAINVGDSRMYRLTGNDLEQLTEDHSLVEALVREGRITPAEAEVHPQRNIVTRALGVTEHVEVDSFHFVPKIGDRYLLCSDGLFNEVDPLAIATILDSEPDPQVATGKLIAAANEGGGRDNITTVVVDIVPADEAAIPERTQAMANEVKDLEDDTTEKYLPEAAAEVEAAGPDELGSQKKQRWPWRR